MTSDSHSIDRRNRVQAVDIASQILVALGALRRPAHLKEVSDIAGIQPAKAHRYMASLIDNGFAWQNASTGLYELGPTARKLGIFAIESNDVVGRARSSLGELCLALKTSGHLTIWGERGPVIISTEHGGAPIISTMGVGATLPLLRSATGRAYLSYMPTRTTAEIVASERDALNLTDADVDEIRESTRNRGYAQIFGELVPGLFAVSFPVFEIDRSLACAITLISTDAGMFATASDGLNYAVEKHRELIDAN